VLALGQAELWVSDHYEHEGRDKGDLENVDKIQ
jgi:hypothetical protein